MSSRLERRSFYHQLGETARNNQTYVAPSNLRWGTLTQGLGHHDGPFNLPLLELRETGLGTNEDLSPMMPMAAYVSTPVYSGELRHQSQPTESYSLPNGPGNWMAPHHQSFSRPISDQEDLRSHVAQLQTQLLASYNREQQLKDRSIEPSPSRGGRSENTKERHQPDPSAETIKALEKKISELEQAAVVEVAKRKEAEARERGANKSLSVATREKNEATRSAEELERRLQEVQGKASAIERTLQDHARAERSELERLKSQRAMDANQNRMAKDHLARVEHEKERLRDKLKSLQFENNALQQRVDELVRENAAMASSQKRGDSQKVNKLPSDTGSSRQRQLLTALSPDLAVARVSMQPPSASLDSVPGDQAVPEIKTAPVADPFAQIELLG